MSLVAPIPKGVGRDRALLGCASLPEREWDHANGYKQNQAKGTSKKLGFNRRD